MQGGGWIIVSGSKMPAKQHAPPPPHKNECANKCRAGTKEVCSTTLRGQPSLRYMVFRELRGQNGILDEHFLPHIQVESLLRVTLSSLSLLVSL